MKRVLLADDHPFMMAGLKAFLEANGYQVVAKEADGASALAGIAVTNPDVILLDIAMPVKDGIEVLREIRDCGDARRVILFTAKLDQEKLLAALHLRADGILLKQAAEDKLLQCLDTVLEGRRWMDPVLVHRAAEISLAGYGPKPAGSFTKRERDIVRYVAKGLRNRQIAAELGTTEGAIKISLHRLYHKLRISNRAQLVQLAGKGLGNE
jgi:two-component system nitrate/nitrite response regulator NarP